MPVYLFTFHTYRTWMPDHPRGYTKRNEGYQLPDSEMARRYDERANHPDEVLLDAELQRALIDESIIASKHQHFPLHAAFTEPSPIHDLVSWTDARSWEGVRTSLKSSLSRKLKTISEKERDGAHLALSRGASRKQVNDQAHFDYLCSTYLTKHAGLKWTEEGGFVV